MSGLNWAKRVITAKIEGIYDQDALPAAIDGVVAYNMSITPMQGETQDDDALPNGMLGGAAQTMINKTVALEFEIDWVGHAVPGTAAPASAILRCMCFSEVVTPLVDATYSLVSENEESATIYFYLDGHLHKVTGCKGKASYAITPDSKLRLKCSIVGNFHLPTKEPFPAVNFGGYQKALSSNPSTFKNFSLHGWAGDPRSIEVDSGSDIQPDVLLTKRESVLADRGASGSIVVENPDFATKNWFQAIDNDEVGPLSFDVDEGAGRIVKVSHPMVQLLEPNYDNEKNRTTLAANLNVFPDRDNQVSEFNFTFT